MHERLILDVTDSALDVPQAVAALEAFNLDVAGMKPGTGDARTHGLAVENVFGPTLRRSITVTLESWKRFGIVRYTLPLRSTPTVYMPEPAQDVLHRVFGLSGFRGAQAEIIAHLCDGGDALVLMPTGGGKSLCY